VIRALILKIPQPVRFVLAGGTVAVVNLCTTLLLNTVGVPLQVAIPIGYVLGLTLHFTLQRLFVFANHDEFNLELHHQLGRYLATAGGQYLATAGLTALLPGLLGLDQRVVYVGVVVVLTVVTYLVNRAFVFHGSSAPPADESTSA
jgi:putative flippase GtrA